MWAFVEGGLRPDLVTLGKPMGNGHPVAAVITRREVAEAMATRYEFFSTFAGSPVSAIAALDHPRRARGPRAGPQGRHAPATTCGRSCAALRRVRAVDRRSARSRAAGGRRDAIAAHRVRVSAPQVAERLRQERVLVGVTGRDRDVLKVRPPLVWEPRHVDHLVDALRRVAARSGEPPTAKVGGVNDEHDADAGFSTGDADVDQALSELEAARRAPARRARRRVCRHPPLARVRARRRFRASQRVRLTPPDGQTPAARCGARTTKPGP